MTRSKGVVLKPFWRYYGGKYRAAPHYPKPKYDRIIEPFAGSAGYSMRYPEREVILVEKYPVIAEIWRWLIAASPEEVLSIPCVDAVADLPDWVPEGARYLVGFCMNSANVSPCKVLSAGRKRMRATGRKFEGWNEARRERAASQVPHIKHWKILECDYRLAPDVKATWFIDPPYNNKAGSHYVHSDLDYRELGQWCQTRRGQVIVCENEGADWLPFQTFRTLKASICANGNTKGSREVIWTQEV